MREQLLGYLLGALDDSEHEEVREHLQNDSELRRDLRRLQARLAPLEATRIDVDPPKQLTEATCNLVAAHVQGPAVRPTTGAAASPSTSTLPAPLTAARSCWLVSDLVVAAGIAFAAAMLFFPAITNSRDQTRLTGCRNNLRHLGAALSKYSEQHGCFPLVPARGKLAFAGVYAPLLVGEGYLTDPRRLLCPASPLARDPASFHVAALEEIRSAEGRELARLRSTSGGSYGYGFGYVDRDEHYRANTDRGRAHFALAADVPSLRPVPENSLNHGGRGQNVLFENGSVRYLTTCREPQCCDQVFVSDRGRVEAGRHRDDAVIGRGSATPICPVSFPK